MIVLPFPREEYERRWRGVSEEMRRRELDTIVVWGRGGGTYERFQEVYYLTNFYSNQGGHLFDGDQPGLRAAAHCAVILRRDQEPILIADESGVLPESVATRRIDGGLDPIEVVARCLAAEGIEGRVGIVGADFLSFRYFTALRELTPGITWDFQDDVVRDVRVIKSPRELDKMRSAGETVSCAMNAMFAALQSGASQAEAAGEAAKLIYRRQGKINFILLNHGPSTEHLLTEQPLAGYSQETPAEGDIVRGWIYGPMCDGYWVDPGRTTVIGLKPRPDQKRLIETCADIVEQCRLLIRPGVDVSDVFQLGQRLRREFGGVDDQMARRWPIIGHGNGLFWDPPTITEGYRGKHGKFREGMVGSTETYLALPGVGGAGFEQNFIVTRDGTELLTTTPLIWW